VLQLQQLIDNWISIGQTLVGSIGALAFMAAFLWKMVAIEPRSVLEARRWIGRIIFGTVGVEMASVLIKMLLASVPAGAR